MLTGKSLFVVISILVLVAGAFVTLLYFNKGSEQEIVKTPSKTAKDSVKVIDPSEEELDDYILNELERIGADEPQVDLINDANTALQASSQLNETIQENIASEIDIVQAQEPKEFDFERGELITDSKESKEEMLTRLSKQTGMNRDELESMFNGKESQTKSSSEQSATD